MRESIIPFLGVLIGAGASFAGVLISLRAERKKAKEEREFIAKHEAFIAALVAVSKFVDYYMTLPDRQLPSNGKTDPGLSEMGIALNRLHFYSGFQTIQDCTKLSETLTLSLIKAIEAKRPSIIIDADIKTLDLQLEFFEKVNSKIEQEILVLIGRDPNSEMILFHREQLVKNYEEISHVHGQRAALIKDRYRAVENCRDVVAKDFQQVHSALSQLLIMARKELSFPIDESRYAKLMEESAAAAKTELKKFLKRNRDEVEKRMN